MISACANRFENSVQPLETDNAPLDWIMHTGLKSGDRVVLGDANLPRLFRRRMIPFDMPDAKRLRDEAERQGGRSTSTAIVQIEARTRLPKRDSEKKGDAC